MTLRAITSLFRLYEPVVPLADHQRLQQSHNALVQRYAQQEHYVRTLERQLRDAKARKRRREAGAPR